MRIIHCISLFILVTLTGFHLSSIGSVGNNVNHCESGSLIFGPARGIFMMVNLPYTSESADKIVEIINRNECVDGLFIRINWNEIEGSDGVFKWDQIDWAVDLARQNNLQYKMMLLPGEFTPGWVYDKGAAPFYTTFPWPMRKEYGKKIRIPLPWDTVYLNYFERLLVKFSDRYQKDRNFVAITLTGVNFNYGEMHLPKTKEDISQWETYGDYPGKIEGVYKQLIDLYSSIFPNQQLVLHVCMPIPGMEENVEDIIRYGIQESPEQFTLQNAQLTGHNSNQGMFSYRLIYKFKDQVHVGFQSLHSFVSFHERVGSPEVATYNFINADAVFWEIFVEDAADRHFACDLTRMIDHARSKGAQAYLQELEKEGKLKNNVIEKRQKISDYRASEDYEMALKMLDETFRFIYSDIREKVELLQLAGKTQEAVDFLKKIISQRNSAAFHDMLAEVYQNNDDIKNAASHYKLAFELSHNGSFLLKAAKVLADHEMKSQAIGLCNQYLDHEHFDESAMERVTDLYSTYGYKEAIKKLKKRSVE